MRRGVTVEHGKRRTDAERTAAGVRAKFTDGGHVGGDLLVGADGSHSWCRRIVDPAAPAARYIPFLQINGQVSGLLRGDRSPAVRIIEATPQIKLPQARYDLPNMPTWRWDRMILIGDAAPAASPAFGCYERLRRERVGAMVAHGKHNGDQFVLDRDAPAHGLAPQREIDVRAQHRLAVDRDLGQLLPACAEVNGHPSNVCALALDQSRSPIDSSATIPFSATPTDPPMPSAVRPYASYTTGSQPAFFSVIAATMAAIPPPMISARPMFALLATSLSIRKFTAKRSPGQRPPDPSTRTADGSSCEQIFSLLGKNLRTPH
ncbi:MAG: FAD-dependent oxidoreductase [Pseudonocardiaceae bacterium]